MSGSFSKQSSKEQATSSQQGYGEQASSSFGEQGAQSSSISQGQSVGGSSQSLAFEDVFRQLYGDSGAAAKAVDTGAISEQSKQLFGSGTGFLEQLSNLGSSNATDAKLAALKSTLGDFYNEQVMPGVQSEGIATGTFGGSRDAVAAASAAKAVGSQYATGAANILGQQDQLKLQGAGEGLSALQSLFNVGQGGELAGLQPYQILGQILGGPQALSQSFSQSSDIASQISNSFGVNGSQSYGFDFNTGQSQSTGSSKGVGASGGLLAPKA